MAATTGAATRTKGRTRGATSQERKAELALIKLVDEEPGIAVSAVFDALLARGVRLPQSVVARATVRMINDGRLVLTESRKLRRDAA